MKIARVFPRKTNASPDDPLAYFSYPEFPYPEVDEIHVSVTFSYDKRIAEQMAKAWEIIAPVKIGGPTYDDSGGYFIPAMIRTRMRDEFKKG